MKTALPTAWMIIPTYFPVVGGAQVQVQYLSRALPERGWPAAVVTRRHSYAHPRGLPAADLRAGVRVRRISSPGGGKVGALLFVLNGLLFLARAGRGGIYHAHDAGAAGWLAAAARFLLGGRCLVKLRTGRPAYEQHLRSRLVRWQFRALLACADRVIVVSREMQAYLSALGVPAERVVWIPNGVDVERFCPPGAAVKAQQRARLGIAPGKSAVLYVGRLEHMKGVDVLLRGWQKLSEARRQNSRLYLAGDGPEREPLKRMAAELGVAGSVRFLGEQADVMPFYQAADLFVLPSRTEGLSNALIEAMACGLPVVASEVGGAKDLVQDGLNGFFFPSEDSAALAARLEAALASPESWKARGRAARASVTANASLAAVVQKIEAVYRELSAGMGRAPLRQQASYRGKHE